MIKKLLVQGEHLFCFVAISIEGVLAKKEQIVTHSTTWCISLITKLMPFINGTNPKSVIVLDNCFVYRVTQALDGCGVITHCLPHYSSAYYHIELPFKKF